MSNFIYDPAQTIESYLESLYNKHLENQYGLNIGTGNFQQISGNLSDRLESTGSYLLGQMVGGGYSITNPNNYSNSGNLYSTGLFIQNEFTSLSGDVGTIRLNLTQSGINLLNTLSSVKITGSSTILQPNFTGANNVNLYLSGANTIFISGDTSNLATQSQIATLTNNLVSTGATLLNSDLIISGNLTNTGINILGKITSLSGDYLSDVSNLTQTGISLMNKIISLSGDLLSSGSNLFAKINLLSGNVVSTGITLLNQIGSLSGDLGLTGINLLERIQLVSGNLITSGQNLDNKIGTLSGQAVFTNQTGNFYRIENFNNYVNSGNLALTGSNLFVNDTILSGKQLSLSGDLLSSGANLNSKISTVSGLAIDQLTGVSITGSNSLIGLVNFTGLGIVNVSQSGNTITFSGSAAGGGEINTASSLGGGLSLYNSKVGVDLRFNSISGGTGTSIRNINNIILVDAKPQTLLLPFSLGPLILTNMALATGFFNASSAYIAKVDLFGYTGVKLMVNKTAVAGAAASHLGLRYFGAFSATFSDYLQLDTNSTKSRINFQNVYIDSGYQPIVAGAKSGVYVALIAGGGDGAIDPAVGNVYVSFQ